MRRRVPPCGAYRPPWKMGWLCTLQVAAPPPPSSSVKTTLVPELLNVAECQKAKLVVSREW
ncbi:hypothetical protein [Micromonospora avicenniae]|uniref:hypothetical protein n=1 Tax=Micromonospora avicenniae TaxID=1198245 RepID=UPI0033220A56